MCYSKRIKVNTKHTNVSYNAIMLVHLAKCIWLYKSKDKTTENKDIAS